MQHEVQRYRDGDVELEGFAAWDDSSTGRRPLVLVCHAWGGLGEFEREKARLLARAGWVGFAVDVYGAGRRGTDAATNAALMKPFVDDRALLERRLRAALTAGRALDVVDGERCAAIGFCFGGLCALDLARAGVGLRGVVSFHGLLGGRPGMSTARSDVRVLALHGHDDPLVSREQFDGFCAEMTTAGIDWQIHQYGHTVHAFTNPAANDRSFGTVYEPKAERRSLAAMRAHLEECFA